MGGGLVCSPTLPLFSPFAGIPTFPAAPLSPAHRRPLPRGVGGLPMRLPSPSTQTRPRLEVGEGLSGDGEAGGEHSPAEEPP